MRRGAAGPTRPISHLTGSTVHQSHLARLAAIWQAFFKYWRRPAPLSDGRGRPVNHIGQMRVQQTLQCSSGWSRRLGPMGSERAARMSQSAYFSLPASFLIVQWPEREREAHMCSTCFHGTTGYNLLPKHWRSCDTTSLPLHLHFVLGIFPFLFFLWRCTRAFLLTQHAKGQHTVTIFNVNMFTADNTYHMYLLDAF